MTRTDLRARCHELGLHGLLEHWEEVVDAEWLPWLLGVEGEERQRRSLERRIKNARLGRFKAMADFDWDWPKRIDRVQIDDLLHLEFIPSYSWRGGGAASVGLS